MGAAVFTSPRFNSTQSSSAPPADAVFPASDEARTPSPHAPSSPAAHFLTVTTCAFCETRVPSDARCQNRRHEYQWTPVDRVRPGDLIRIGGTGTPTARVIGIEPRTPARTAIEYRYLSGDERPVWLLFDRATGGVYVEREATCAAYICSEHGREIAPGSYVCPRCATEAKPLVMGAGR